MSYSHVGFLDELYGTKSPLWNADMKFTVKMKSDAD